MTITETSPTTPQIDEVHGLWPTMELSQRIRVRAHAFLATDADVAAAPRLGVPVDAGVTRRSHDVTQVGVWRALNAFGHVLAIMAILAAVAVGMVILAGWSKDTVCLPNCICVQGYGQPVGSRLTLNATPLASSSALERPVALTAGVCAPQ